MALDGDGNGYSSEEGTSLRKVPSRGGLWHDDVSPRPSHVCPIGHMIRVSSETTVTSAIRAVDRHQRSSTAQSRARLPWLRGCQHRLRRISLPSFYRRPLLCVAEATSLELRASVLSTNTSILLGSPSVSHTRSSPRDAS